MPRFVDEIGLKFYKTAIVISISVSERVVALSCRVVLFLISLCDFPVTLFTVKQKRLYFFGAFKYLTGSNTVVFSRL